MHPREANINGGYKYPPGILPSFSTPFATANKCGQRGLFRVQKPLAEIQN